MRRARSGKFARLVLRVTATGIATAAALLALGVWHVGGKSDGTAGAVDAPRPIVPLENVPVPRPENLGQFVKDESAGVALGKALFWDMQVGSDGVTSCASCHFDAGADSRSKNQLNPRVGPFLHQANHQLTPDDFPFHQLADPNDRHSDVVADTGEVSGSAGVLPSAFRAVVPGSPVEDTTSSGADPVFNVGGVNVRRATGRNAPS